MRKTLTLLSLIGIALINPLSSVVSQVPPGLQIPVPSINPQVSSLPPLPTRPLKLIDAGNECKSAARCVGWDEQLFWKEGKAGDRQALLASIDNSLRYLDTPTAARIYQNYPIREITLDRTRRSLLRFRQLLVASKSAAQLQAAVNREFVFYKSVGNDGNGTVKYTAYYQPVYTASRVRTEEYKYPLYREPSDLDQWSKPQPKRME